MVWLDCIRDILKRLFYGILKGLTELIQKSEVLFEYSKKHKCSIKSVNEDNLHLIGASNDLATVTITFVPNTQNTS